MSALFLETIGKPFFNPYIYYALCTLLAVGVLLGIFLMSKVKLSVLGNKISAVCMALGIVLVLIYNQIFPSWVLYIGIAVGAILGFILSIRAKMIEMPEIVALLNGLGGGASAIVGAFALMGIGAGLDAFSLTTSGLALAIGIITLFGSLVAAGKLHRLLPQKPIVLRGHQALTSAKLIGLLAVIILSTVLVSTGVMPMSYMWIMLVLNILLSSAFGILFSIRVGGADMPITISLLNSLSGVAGAIAGLAIGDILLVAVGGIVGASGLLLTQIMCKAINRHLMDILLGKTSGSGKEQQTTKDAVPTTKADNTDKEVKPKEDPITVLNNAKNVIIVPGYGMAIAQAQHLVKQLADKLVTKGAKVKYAIHPVAGRMPGHMNVLLCEANVDYEDLYEMSDINDEFATADLTVVVGANDVLNPAAREAVGTPIYGMPVLNVDKCKNVFIFNYDTKPGYAGVQNPLYTKEEGVYLYLGNAAETLNDVLSKI
ncbi:MAG TPA: NAD(P)(+) transhydrogenase (Re/Si-specific) subunit beta [Clostridia bacterium]|nr:NAD(P)(+) transhydrogenase (Re/Si-specific) subunit beta [Clostridia bacterium]